VTFRLVLLILILQIDWGVFWTVGTLGLMVFDRTSCSVATGRDWCPDVEDKDDYHIDRAWCNRSLKIMNLSGKLQTQQEIQQVERRASPTFYLRSSPHRHGMERFEAIRRFAST